VNDDNEVNERKNEEKISKDISNSDIKN